jgi:hypothetical protein
VQADRLFLAPDLDGPKDRAGVLMRWDDQISRRVTMAPSLWRDLIGCAVVIGIFVASSSSPKAQQIVSCVNCTDEVTTVINDAAVLAQWATQIADMVNQIRQEITIWQQLSGLTNVNSLVTVLNQAVNFDSLSTYGNIPQMLQGSGFGVGGLGQSYATANTYFMPSAGSVMPLLNEVETLFNQRGASLANTQAIAAQLLATSTTTLNGLLQLQQDIDQQPNVQQMGGIHARLTSYQGDISSQAYQLQQVRLFASAQKQVFDQQEQQAVLCSAYSWASNTQPLSGAGLTVTGTGTACTTGRATIPVAGTGGRILTGTGSGGSAATAAEAGTFDTGG